MWGRCDQKMTLQIEKKGGTREEEEKKSPKNTQELNSHSEMTAEH